MSALTQSVPAWLVLLSAVPLVLLGEGIVGRVRALARYSIPPAVVGGLIAAVFVLCTKGAAGGGLRLELGTAARAWTWLVTVEPEWLHAPVKSVHLPFLAAFFANVGLAANWPIVRRAGRPVLVFLFTAAAVAVLQNLVGVVVASWLGVSPLLGLVCGSMSMTGGHATTLGFAAEFERAGLPGAQVMGTAAATLGLVAGALLTGPIGSGLVRRHGLVPRESADSAGLAPGPVGLWADVRCLGRAPVKLLVHALLLAVCVKAGAWISHLLQMTGIVFPVFVGTLFAGVIARNTLEALRVGWFEPRLSDALASIALAVFLATAMSALNLGELAHAAGPMLVILGAQVVFMAAFAWWITFPLMGRDYDAAVVAGGHCGFGLGSTSTAVAGMKALADQCGPSPRAFLIVPLVGGFLIDLLNALNLTVFISIFRSP